MPGDFDDSEPTAGEKEDAEARNRQAREVCAMADGEPIARLTPDVTAGDVVGALTDGELTTMFFKGLAQYDLDNRAHVVLSHDERYSNVAKAMRRAVGG